MHSPWDRQSRFPDPSLEPPSAVPFPSGPPRALPKPTLEPPGPPQDPPGSPQGRPRTPQIRNVDHQKPSEICVFDPQRSQKSRFVHFLDLSWGSWDALWSAPTPSRPSPWCSKALPSPPRDLPGRALGPLEHPCEFQPGHCFVENRRLSDFTHISHPFYRFSITIIPLQIGPCQLLHIFGRGFHFFTNRTHFPDPLGTPRGPPWTPPRTLFW